MSQGLAWRRDKKGVSSEYDFGPELCDTGGTGRCFPRPVPALCTRRTEALAEPLMNLCIQSLDTSFVYYMLATQDLGFKHTLLIA